MNDTPPFSPLFDGLAQWTLQQGLHETTVPFIVNRPLVDDVAARLAAGELRNFDLFHVLCNGIREP